MITRKQAQEIVATSWDLGACNAGLDIVKSYSGRVDTSYNLKKEDCAALAKKLEDHFRLINKGTSEYKDLKKLSIFAQEGGATDRFDLAAAEAGFGQMDIGAYDSAKIRMTLNEEICKFKK
jgi:hypothetical protein